MSKFWPSNWDEGMGNPCKFPPRKKIVYQETPETKKLIRIWNLEIGFIGITLILASMIFLAAIFSNAPNGLDARAMTGWMLALYNVFCAPALWIGIIVSALMGPFLGVPAFIIASYAQWKYIWRSGKRHILEQKKNPTLGFFIILLLTSIPGFAFQLVAR